MLVSPIGGTADVPPVAEGHDAEPASLVNLRSSGSPGPVELPSVHMPRAVGPFRGGRVVAVCGDYENPSVFYFGACAGGVWKTTDAGTYWQNVSDGFFNTDSFAFNCPFTSQ